MAREDATPWDAGDQFTTPTPQTLARWAEAEHWLEEQLAVPRTSGVIRVRLQFDTGQIRRWFPRQVRGARPGENDFTETVAAAGVRALEAEVQSALGRNFFGEVVFTAGWRDGQFAGWSLDVEQSK